MKVLLDTNVLASAAATRGLCADVLREVLIRHELVVCPQILTELRRALRDKFGVPTSLINDFLGMLRQDTMHVNPRDLPDVELKDHDDLGILAAALDGGVRFLITGDKELLGLGEFSGIRIVSPRQFWETLTAQSETGDGA